MDSIRGFFAVLALCGAASAGQICSLVFDQCPGNFTSGALTVPSSVIWIEAKLPVCSENIQIQTGTNSPPPSIVFVIDNSGSMGTGRGGTDPDQARFRVVKEMLDSIYKLSPSAEVGLSIFTRRLAFDDRDNPFFKPVFPGDSVQHDAYVPLTALNKSFGDKLGLDTLKALLAFTGSGDLTYATKTPNPRPNARLPDTDFRNGTDITLGFQGAKAALKDAKAAKDNQYIIFLSDGKPDYVDDSRAGVINEFESGKDVPTTFTVFFTGTSRDTVPPPTIRNMTDSIRANGYSATNPKSAYWAINQPGLQLSTLLQNSVLNPIFTNTAGKPISAVMTVGANTFPSTSVDGKTFTFGKSVALSSDQTLINLSYTYQYVDSGKTKTKVVPYALTVKRAAGAALPAGVASACQEQGDITLFSKDTPINVVTADHAELDVHLTLGGGETCNGCHVEVKPGKSADRENVTLTPAGGFQKGTFKRITSATPAPNDGTLQHLPTDSIIVTYVNPDNPLDVIRKAFPYNDVSTQVGLTRHNEWARASEVATVQPNRQFVIVGPQALAPTPFEVKNWGMVPDLSGPEDSLRYVGNVIEASRAFRTEVDIFSNLGQFVNKVAFTVPQSEFLTLSKGARNGTRRLRLLWDSRDQKGRPVGTGAYIMKTTVTLLRIPGVAEDEASSTDFRLVGVLRQRK